MHTSLLTNFKKTFKLSKIAMGIATGERQFTGPLFAQIGLTSRCNQSCTMCWTHSKSYDFNNSAEYNVPDKSAFFDTELCKRVIHDYHRIGTCKIEFVGDGEPFMHPDIIDIVSHALSYKLNVSITSNGSLIKENTAQRLVDMGVPHIRISLDAATGDVYSQIHRPSDPDDFENIKNMIKCISEYKWQKNKILPMITLSFILSRKNFHEISDMLEIAGDTGADFAYFKPVCCNGVECPSLELSDREIAYIKEKLPLCKRLAGRLGVYTNLDSLELLSVDKPGSQPDIPCYVGWFFSSVSNDGMVTVCCQCLKPIGNVYEKNFADIWASPEYNDFRRKSKTLARTKRFPDLRCSCSDCSFYAHNLSIFNVLNFGRKTKNNLAFKPFSLRDIFRFRKI